jgi:hypothetical protein
MLFIKNILILNILFLEDDAFADRAMITSVKIENQTEGSTVAAYNIFHDSNFLGILSVGFTLSSQYKHLTWGLVFHNLELINSWKYCGVLSSLLPYQVNISPSTM